MVADDTLARAGLASMLAAQPESSVVGQIPGDEDGLATLDVYQAAVLVWDLGPNPTEALDRLSDLSDLIPPVVALLPDEGHAANAWAAGARGLLPRHTGTESLLATVTAVSQGMVVLDPDLASVLAPSAGQLPVGPPIELTPRERDVLTLLAEGLPNKSIAHRLNISEHTVKFHVNSLFSKLGAGSRTEAVITATRVGLILL